MSKLFASSSPFSQTTYTPLRESQDLGPDDDDDPESSSLVNINHHNRYHHPSSYQHRQQFRHRSQSQSSNRSFLAMADQQQQQPPLQMMQSPGRHPVVFAEGEEDFDQELKIPQPYSRRISSASSSPSGPTTGASPNASSAIDRMSMRSHVSMRPQSLVNATAVSSETATTPMLISGRDIPEENEPSSPPPKYTTEDLEYSEPAGHSYGIDEETGLGYRVGEDGQGDGLLMQASTTLVIAVSGLICAGWLLDVIQHWQVFIDISELIILIPILLNLKGNLEMNLASRLSTAANMGLLDLPSSRNAFIKGNLALLQLQSLAVGSVAGLFSFGLGVVVHPTTNNVNEIALMITASMLCAAISSFVLGSFMCGLVLVCRRYRINPDNIACPLASSFGDLVTLVILAACAVFLQKYLNSPLSIVILVALMALIPAWIVYVRRNKFVAEVAKEGWGPVFAAMVIASTAGLTLERYINEFPGMALISPVLNGLTGNIGSIYASRISTSLHANVKENYRETEKTLFLVHIPIQIVFLTVIGILGLGHVRWSVPVVLGYALVSLCLVVISLAMAKWITHLFWRLGYDPDNYALPILTSLIDVIGTAFLVAGFWALRYGKAMPDS
ncbi:hypothetical protein KVV02_003306 [Mortierella alpina]|uniref:SLC41A/MgtE integral membrane domain-containing protein n=1 Tax=Mortierella alpina TaxID=64518 RepID=A0A9P8A9P8_MORAP|nr:hypothetical protein KVV02_003306 [Mortierella alpina]